MKNSRGDYLHEFEDNYADETAVVTDEVAAYLQTRVQMQTATGDNILNWWRVNSPSFPHLATVAKGILSIPASSAASEQSFSVAGSTVSQRRTAIDSDNLEDILFVHSNS